MNATVDRVRIPFPNDSFRKQHSHFKGIGASTNRREQKCTNFLSEFQVNAIARERRKKEIEDFETKILLRRRREQTRRLTPRQLQLLSQLPFVSSTSSTESSSAPSSGSRSSDNTSKSSYDEPSFESFGDASFEISRDYESLSVSTTPSPSPLESSTKIKFRAKQSVSLSLEKDEVETWKKYSDIHEAKQYRALMKEVCKTKYYDLSDPSSRGWFGPDQTKDLLDESLDRLREDIGSSMPWPEDAFFEMNFKTHYDPAWMVVEIKELVTVPDNLALFENCELSGTAAAIRMAAWDHLFFTNRKAGGKNIAALFCKLMEGETPTDRFLHPSQKMIDFRKLECLWKPLIGTQVLEEYFIWVLRQKKDLVPEYLEKNGYIKDLIDNEVPKRCSQSAENLSISRRKTMSSILNKYPEFKDKLNRYL